MEVNDDETRRQRIEENRKRMQELGLLDFVEGLRPEKHGKAPGRIQTKPKTSSPHQSAGLASRRSSRTASKPPVDYKYSKDVDKYIGSTPADIAVMEAVDEAFTKLANPGFLRHVLYTYGAGSYHAYIPIDFRNEHMPETDKWFTLEDEDQVKWSVLFNSEFGDLRKGWNVFSSHHALMAGDCCLFELVSRFRFRVRIFRYDERDGGGSRSRMGSNRKRVSGEGQWKEKVSSRRTSAIPEDFDVLIDRKPKVEAEILEDHRNGDRREVGLAIPIDKHPKVKTEPEPEILEDHRNGDRRETGLAMPIDRDPKTKAEPVDDYQSAPREAHLSIPIDRKPKLENLEDCRNAHPRETRFASPISARMPIPKGGNWTLDNPD